MKKILAAFMVTSVALSASAEDGFFGDLIVSDQMKKEEAGQAGQIEAGKILDAAPKKFELQNRRIQTNNLRKEQAEPEIRQPAPFGLKWLATLTEIKDLRVRLRPVEVKDSPHTYAAYNLPKAVSAFRDVLISFGDNNSLWRIAAYGRFIKDDAAASKGVAEYRKYYDMLAQKYGNPQQFYSPAIQNVEEVIPNEDGTTSTSLKQSAIEIGDEGFLRKLMTGEATLYATFESDDVGVTLALLADGDGQTYIIVDYKNLSAAKKEDEELFDAL